MNKILNPDRSNSMLRLYHKNNNMLLPLGITNWMGRMIDINSNIQKAMDIGLVTSIGHHSFVSIASVVSDYLPKITKNIKVMNIVKGGNIGLHAIACLGFMRNILKK